MKEQSSNEYIERYVAAVGRHLPRRNREDVEAELRSTLLDMLEDRRSGDDQTPDEELVTGILQQMGSPESMAASFTGNQSLIGPSLYPTFMQVARIFFFVVLGAQLLGLFITVAISSGKALPSIGETLASLLTSLFSALGVLVLIFALLERSTPVGESTKDTTWNPNKLLAIDKKDMIRPAGKIVDIVVTVAAFTIFNFYRDLVGIHIFRDGAWFSYSILTAAFAGYLPALNLYWGLETALDYALIRQGAWQTWSRWAKLGLTILGICILAAMIAGKPILDFSPAMAVGSTGLNELEELWLLGEKFNPEFQILALVLLAFGISLIKQALNLVKTYTTPAIQHISEPVHKR